jgi:S1-C subfamily serine protease
MKTSFLCRYSLGICAATAFLFGTSAQATLAVPADGSNTYTSIEPSLAFVVAPIDTKHFGAGTAFCIGDRGNEAYFLTNHHVVGRNAHVAMLLLSDRSHVFNGDVVRVATTDAAVLAVHGTSCVPLSLSPTLPQVGTSIAIAGFPNIQMELAKLTGTALEASFHQGTISSVTPNGVLLEYDAQTDHGNSGSPLFDAQTGVVYGLVTWADTGVTGALQNNLAIPTLALRDFLTNAHANVNFTSPRNDANQTALSAGSGTVSGAIDARCGQGTSHTILTSIENAWGEINGNNYATAVSEAQAGIVAASTCSVVFAPNCQSSTPCKDAPYIFILHSELLGQQLLRVAAARNNGDWGYAEKNEIQTALTICNSPNIQVDGKVYQQARSGIAETFRVYRSNYRARQTSGVDIDSVRACAQKLNIPF